MLRWLTPRAWTLGRSAVIALFASGCASTPTRPPVTTEAPTPPATSEPASGDPFTATPAPDSVAEPVEIGVPPPDAETTPSGLRTKVLAVGTGTKHPSDADHVRVRYQGWKENGEEIEPALVGGEPEAFSVKDVIPGWTEALKLMVTSEKRRIWIPENLAYGSGPAFVGAPAGNLIFDIELLEIVEPPPTPPDVAAPPKTATRTKSGLAYAYLVHGTGTRHPTKTDRVLVHYSGWTTDGKLFDSSVSRGEPSSFSLDQVIKGWTEGVSLMVEGDKLRFWIPGDLAYGKSPRPGVPTGMLVFDVELLEIQ